MTRRLETRRACFTLIGAAAAVSASAWAELSLMSAHDDTSANERALARKLRQRLDPDGNMHPFGGMYLSSLPDTPSIGQIVRELFGKDLPLTVDDELTRRLGSRIEKDFATGALISVEGWLLSRSEALVCALMVALETDRHREL